MLLCYSPSSVILQTGIASLENTGNHSLSDTIIVTINTGQKSRIQLRKIKLRMTWLSLKQKLKSFFVARNS
jgi:hypothetical protein